MLQTHLSEAMDVRLAVKLIQNTPDAERTVALSPHAWHTLLRVLRYATANGSVTREELVKLIGRESPPCLQADQAQLSCAAVMHAVADYTELFQNKCEEMGVRIEKSGPVRAARVNSFVDDVTDGLAKGFLDGIATDTHLVLVSDVHLKALWKTAFSAERSRQEAAFFTPFGRSAQPARVMCTAGPVQFVDTQGCEVFGGKLEGFCLPYAGDRLTAYFLLPCSEGQAALDHMLDLLATHGLPDQWTLSSRPAEIPAVTIDCPLSVPLKKLFPSLCKGDALPYAFEGDDSGGVGYAASRVRVRIDERGAAPSDPTVPGGAPPLRFNRPFVYAVLDSSRAVPFMAVVRSLE